VMAVLGVVWWSGHSDTGSCLVNVVRSHDAAERRITFAASHHIASQHKHVPPGFKGMNIAFVNTTKPSTIKRMSDLHL